MNEPLSRSRLILEAAHKAAANARTRAHAIVADAQAIVEKCQRTVRNTRGTLARLRSRRDPPATGSGKGS